MFSRRLRASWISAGLTSPSRRSSGFAAMPGSSRTETAPASVRALIRCVKPQSGNGQEPVSRSGAWLAPTRQQRKLPLPMAGRVVIADDDVLLREGVASLLTGAGYEVVGQAGDPDTLNEVVR